jgi:hypothetical protein
MVIRLVGTPLTGRVRASSAAFGVVLALGLSACGSAAGHDAEATDSGPDPTSATTSPSPPANDVKPASGPVLSARGFSFNAPHGWADVTDHAETGVLLSAAHAADDQPLAITVRRVSPGPKSAGAAQTNAMALLKQAGATRIRVLADRTIGGNPAAHVVGIQNLRGTHYQLDVFYVRTPHAGWPMMFATDQYATGERRAAMLASVLQTCHWHKA